MVNTRPGNTKKHPGAPDKAPSRKTPTQVQEEKAALAAVKRKKAQERETKKARLAALESKMAAEHTALLSGKPRRPHAKLATKVPRPVAKQANPAPSIAISADVEEVSDRRSVLFFYTLQYPTIELQQLGI